MLHKYCACTEHNYIGTCVHNYGTYVITDLIYKNYNPNYAVTLIITTITLCCTLPYFSYTKYVFAMHVTEYLNLLHY